MWTQDSRQWDTDVCLMSVSCTRLAWCRVRCRLSCRASAYLIDHVVVDVDVHPPPLHAPHPGTRAARPNHRSWYGSVLPPGDTAKNVAWEGGGEAAPSGNWERNGSYSLRPGFLVRPQDPGDPATRDTGREVESGARSGRARGRHRNVKYHGTRSYAVRSVRLEIRGL